MSSDTAAAVAAGSCFASFLNTSILDLEASASSKEACSLAPNLSCMLDILTYPRSLEAHHFLRAFAQPGAEPDPGVRNEPWGRPLALSFQLSATRMWARL